jgi:hypothetical protein
MTLQFVKLFTKFKNLCTKLDIIKTDIFTSVTFARNNKFYVTIVVLSLFLLTSAISYFIDITFIWWFLNAILIPKELGTSRVLSALCSYSRVSRCFHLTEVEGK